MVNEGEYGEGCEWCDYNAAQSVKSRDEQGAADDMTVNNSFVVCAPEPIFEDSVFAFASNQKEIKVSRSTRGVIL